MSLTSLYVRFLIFYPLTIIATGLLIQFIELDSGVAPSIALHMTLVYILISMYAKKNDHFFNTKERRSVATIFTIIVVVF